MVNYEMETEKMEHKIIIKQEKKTICTCRENKYIKSYKCLKFY